MLSYLTRSNASFDARDLNRALQYGGIGREDRAEFSAAILAHENTIGLRESAADPVTRYSTRALVADEMALRGQAARLAADSSHGVAADGLDAASAKFTLKPEQDAALRHLAGEEGFSMLLGEAGTGKSHTLNAVREAYESEGARVIGLSQTNKVVQQMADDGFHLAATVTRELGQLERGRTAWDSKTVVIVDEAAMLSTEALNRLAGAAQHSGAKLILAGDDAQLSSIDPGGMFGQLRQDHGAAVLKDVQRVGEDAEQKAGFNAMHGGDFKTQLGIVAERGGLHWTEKQADTLKQAAADYVAESTAAPEKSRFMFAYTNKDVDALNAETRALRRVAGQLGEDHSIMTKHGAATFAEGDRVQFTGNGKTQAEKRAGFVNGRVGTVEAIETDDAGHAHMTVALDTKKGQEPRRVSFTVGQDATAGEFDSFKHGYAGTIYKGQGATLDQAFVAHSAHWRSSAAYVALTRHRNDVQIYAAHETVADIDELARVLARSDGKRAATSYNIDEAALLDIAEDIAAGRSAGMSPAVRDAGETIGPATAEDLDAPSHSNAGAVAAAVAGATLDAVANVATQAIETLAGLFEGSTPPPPEQIRSAAEDRAAARREAREAAELQQRIERETRLAALEALKRELGRDVNADEAAEILRNRDRGGGQSL